MTHIYDRRAKPSDTKTEAHSKQARVQWQSEKAARAINDVGMNLLVHSNEFS